MAAGGDIAEVDDEVGPFGEGHEQAASVQVGQVDGSGQEPALVADRPHLDARDLGEIEDEEARIAAVQEPEPAAALLHGQERPCRAVDHDRVAERLRVPDRGDVGLGDVGPIDPIKDRPCIRVEE